MKAIRLPYRNGKVADDYSAELVDYMTPEKFQQRVAAFNNIAMQYGVSRGLLVLPVLLVWVTIIIMVPISIKHETSKKNINRLTPLVLAALVVFFSVIAAGVFTITMIRRSNHLKVTALHELLTAFNVEDNQMCINWRILSDSGFPFDKESRTYLVTSAEQCLIIEIGIDGPMVAVTDITPSQSSPPPYEIAFKDPPPALTPSPTPLGRRTSVLSSRQTSFTLSSSDEYSTV